MSMGLRLGHRSFANTALFSKALLFTLIYWFTVIDVATNWKWAYTSIHVALEIIQEGTWSTEAYYNSKDRNLLKVKVLTAGGVQNSQVFSLFDSKFQHFVQGNQRQNQSAFTPVPTPPKWQLFAESEVNISADEVEVNVYRCALSLRGIIV